MVVELSKFISGYLGKLPEDHPDRPFLNDVDRRARMHLADQGKLVETDQVVAARRKIQEMVDMNIKENGPVSVGVSLHNEKIYRERIDFYGKGYIGSLLPRNSRLYRTIINCLAWNKIMTTSDLIKISDPLGQMKRVGKKRASVILAMRDLAIAEKNQASQKQ